MCLLFGSDWVFICIYIYDSGYSPSLKWLMIEKYPCVSDVFTNVNSTSHFFLFLISFSKERKREWSK